MFFLQSILENTKSFGRPNVPPCRQHQILTRLGPRYTHNVRASFLQPPNKMGLSSMWLLRSPVRSLRRAMLRAVSWKEPASLWKTRRPKRLEYSRILIWKSGCLHQRMILYNQQLLLKMCCKNNLDSIWLFWPGGGLGVLQAGAFVKVPARVLTSSPELRGAGMFSNYVHRLVQFNFAAVHPPSYGKPKLNSENFHICDMFCTSFTAATPYHLRPLGNLTEPWHIGNWNLVDSLQGWTEVQRVECGKMASVYIDMCWFHSTTSTQTCAKSGEWLKNNLQFQTRNFSKTLTDLPRR